MSSSSFGDSAPSPRFVVSKLFAVSDRTCCCGHMDGPRLLGNRPSGRAGWLVFTVRVKFDIYSQ